MTTPSPASNEVEACLYLWRMILNAVILILAIRALIMLLDDPS